MSEEILALLTRIDDALCEYRFADVDKLFLAEPAETITIRRAMGLLMGTFAARRFLTERAPFFARLRVRLEQERPNEAKELLRGLD